MSDTASKDSPHEVSRKQLYSIVSDTDRTVREKEHAVLELGAEYLGVSLGYITAIDTDTDEMEVRRSTDESILMEGSVHDLSRTYCRQCVESDSGIALSDVPAANWDDNGAYERYGLDCYLGVPLYVDGDLVGTLCFADDEVREPSFSPTEQAFVELAARLVARKRESDRFEERLEQREAAIERREQELEDSEQKYQSLLETAPDAILVSDAETHEIIQVNDSAAELTGYGQMDLVGESLAKLSPDDTACRYADAFRESIADGGSTVAELPDGSPIRVQQRDASTVPVEMTATEVDIDGRACVQSILRDISDRREREHELRLKDRAIEKAPVGITIADDGDREGVEQQGLVYGNEHFLETTGYDWDDVSGRNCRFLQGPDTQAEPVEELREHIDNREPVRTELLNYRKDGSPFWNEVTVAPIENANDEVTHYVGFQRDVTERKRQEKLVNVLNRALRHNLRNGMNVILSRANELARSVDDDEQEQVDAIRRRARDLVALGEQANTINQTVTSETVPAAHDVGPVVDSVADRLRSEYPEASVDVAGPDSLIAHTSEALRPALRELGTNAIKHTDSDPEVTFELRDTARGVEIAVTDDGPGLPEEEREVLNRGYETELAHSSGLGLWFVNWVVTGASGSVEVDVDDGTTVTLVLRDPERGGDSSGRRRSTLRD